MEKPRTYADMASQRPKFGKRVVKPKPAEKTVLLYPVNATKEDEEETKKLVKTIIAPKEDGWQIQAIRKVRKGGVVIEAGSVQTAQKIKEATKAQTSLKCVELSRKNPVIQIFDLDGDELIRCLFKQNVEDAGFTGSQVKEGIKCRSKTKQRGEVCNWLVECPPKMRAVLLTSIRGLFLMPCSGPSRCHTVLSARDMAILQNIVTPS